MTGPIWHYDWAHPAPGSYNLGSFGTMTQAHPAPNLALVRHALPDLHHSTIWRLGLHCHTDIIPQSGGFGLHCCIYIVYSLEAWFALPHLHHSTIWRLGLHCHIYIIPQSGGWICTAIFTLFTIWRLGLHCCIHIILQSGPDLNQKFRIIIVLNASSVCHTSRQMTCSEMRSMLSLTKAQPSTAGISLRMVKCKRNIQKPSQAQLGSLLGWSSVMQYPKAQPKCSTEILTSVNG